MNLKGLASRPIAMRLGMFVSRFLPRGIGHRLSWWVAGLIVHLRPPIYRVVEANLRQVMGPEADDPALHRTIRQVFYTAIRGHYDLYRALQLPCEELAASPEHRSRGGVDIPESSQAVVYSLSDAKRGTVLVFPHLGNFDLAGQALAPDMPEMQLLTLPDPPPGFQMANELRRRCGARVTPLSTAALRDAIKLLRRGGVVSLVGDRPVSDLDKPVLFFGRPARMPSAHVRLALKAHAAIVMAYCVLSSDGQRYVV